MAIPWGSIIGAGASLIGGFASQKKNSNAVSDTNATNLEIARQNNEQSADFFNRNYAQNASQWADSIGQSDRNFRRTAYESNRAFAASRQDAARARADQRTFAQNSTGWAFNDLMKSADQSGIHRLAAIGGAQGANYSPVQGQGAAMSYGGSPQPSGGGQLPSLQSPSLETAMMGDIIGPAVTRVAEGYEQKLKEERNHAANSLQRAAVQMEIEESRARVELLKAQATTVLRNARSNDDPTVQVGSAPSPGNSPRGTSPGKTTRPTVGGQPLGHDPTTSDTEAFETRYGELGNIAGAEVARRDFMKSDTLKGILEAFPDEVDPVVYKVLTAIKNAYLYKKPRRSKRPKPKTKFKVNRGTSRIPRSF
ncbi:hypothetical protein [Microviridae sp.]|nr:hypothetical protein [Microviridae sp.]